MVVIDEFGAILRTDFFLIRLLIEVELSGDCILDVSIMLWSLLSEMIGRVGAFVTTEMVGCTAARVGAIVLFWLYKDTRALLPKLVS